MNPEDQDQTANYSWGKKEDKIRTICIFHLSGFQKCRICYRSFICNITTFSFPLEWKKDGNYIFLSKGRIGLWLANEQCNVLMYHVINIRDEWIFKKSILNLFYKKELLSLVVNCEPSESILPSLVNINQKNTPYIS